MKKYFASLCHSEFSILSHSITYFFLQNAGEIPYTLALHLKTALEHCGKVTFIPFYRCGNKGSVRSPGWSQTSQAVCSGPTPSWLFGLITAAVITNRLSRVSSFLVCTSSVLKIRGLGECPLDENQRPKRVHQLQLGEAES